MPTDYVAQLALMRAAQDAAKEAGIDPALYMKLLQVESGGRLDAVSPKGAQGPAQLMPATAASLGVDPRNPRQNIQGGARYLAQLLKQFDNDPVRALAAYNAGPGNVAKYNGVPPFPETQAYVEKILSGLPPQEAQPDYAALLAQFRQAQQAKAPTMAAAAPAAPPQVATPEAEPGLLASILQKGKEYALDAYHHPVDTAVNLLPIAGGTLGATMGAAAGLPTAGIGSGPGAIIGAGVLGGGGEALKQLINRQLRGKTDVPQTPTDAAWEIGKQAAIQAGSAKLGQIVEGFGRGMYAKALDPSKTIYRKSSDVVGTGLKNGIAVTVKGMDKAAKGATASRLATDALVDEAQALGGKPLRMVADVANPVYGDTIAKTQHILNPTRRGLWNDAGRYYTDLIRGNKSSLPLTEARKVLQAEWDDLGPVVSALKEGKAVPIVDKMRVGVADKIKTGIEKNTMALGGKFVTKKGGSTVAAQNLQTQNLKALAQAIRNRVQANTAHGGILGDMMAPIATEGAALATAHPGWGATVALPMAARGVLRNPAFGSQAGRLLYKGRVVPHALTQFLLTTNAIKQAAGEE